MNAWGTLELLEMVLGGCFAVCLIQFVNLFWLACLVRKCLRREVVLIPSPSCHSDFWGGSSSVKCLVLAIKTSN